jgi:hypothetical protein
MAHTHPIFGELLTEAIKSLAAKQHTTIKAIELEIAKRLNCEQPTVQSYRWRRKPTEDIQIEFLVRYFAKHQGRDWCRKFLHQSDYSEDKAKTLLKKLFSLEETENAEAANGYIEEKPKVLKKFVSKLKHLHSLDDCPYCLISSIFLDQIITPVKTTELQEQELFNVNQIVFDLGGSGVWVGRALYGLYRKKSYLFSVQGKGNDELTSIFQKRLKNEALPEKLAKEGTKRTEGDSNQARPHWFYNRVVPIGNEDSCSAVTMHLIQSRNQFSTMLTRVGVLDEFKWDDKNINQLHELLRNGGVMYLSGYLKTKLGLGLDEKLRAFHHNTLICVDHGRFARAFVNRDFVDNLHIAH